MERQKHIFLLDIDGVLLEPHGYRMACIDTFNDLLCQMGQPGLSIDRTVPDSLEASGITAEWDMIPLMLAAFVNWYLDQNGNSETEITFPLKLCHECGLDVLSFRRMLVEQAAVYREMLDPDLTPVNAVYQYLKAHDGKGLETLWKLPCREKFFKDTLDPWKSLFFAQLMNRILGSDIFESFYGFPAPFPCDSYLKRDKLLISDHYRKLIPEEAGKSIFPAVMTYRPTKLPSADGNSKSVYFVNTPEGEIALEFLDWADGRIPMIGAGSLCYIEEKYHLRREYYVKPHPFHALASMAAAICGDELTALETARKLCSDRVEDEPSPIGKWVSPEEKLVLSVFEDSVTGIKSVKNAVEVLRNWGYNAETDLCGIRSTDMKSSLLKNAGAKLYADINDALDDVFQVQN